MTESWSSPRLLSPPAHALREQLRSKCGEAGLRFEQLVAGIKEEVLPSAASDEFMFGATGRPSAINGGYAWRSVRSRKAGKHPR
jgi:hypothetical protein